VVVTTVSALEQNVGPLLNSASVPFRVVGPDSEIAFVWRVRDGRIVHGRTYTDPHDAEAELRRAD